MLAIISDLDPKKRTTLETIWPCPPGARHAKALPRRASASDLRADARREAVRDLVAELGIANATLNKWQRQALIDAGRRPGAKSFAADPLVQARRRIKELEGSTAVFI